MYFLLAIQPRTENSSVIADVENIIRQHADASEYVKALNHLYVIKSDRHRQGLLYSKLLAYFEENKGKLRYAMSPLIDSGRVAGALPSDIWPIIKEITVPKETKNPDVW